MKNKMVLGLALAAMLAMTVVVAPAQIGAAPSSAIDESKVPHYFGPYPNWANSPLTLPDATVTITGASVAQTTVGNTLDERAYATDTATTVFGVVEGNALPAGSLNSFSTWNQVGSAGNVFHAYVLRPTGVVNEYTIVFDSGALTVPALTAPPAGEVVTFPVGPFDTVAGDLIGWYGQGIPVDINTGTDVIAYPGPASAPAASSVFTLGSGSFPVYPQARTYSISASVTPPAAGAGSGATAEATVGANGAVTGLTITNPGSGYAAATVAITGAGSGATATADVQTSGAVTSVAVDGAGAGYMSPSVTISGGGATTDATAHVLGGVDAVDISVQGEGYTLPTVDFDLPDDPDGIQAQGHVVCAVSGGISADCTGATANGQLTVTGVVVDSPGSGYVTAPGVVVRDGTLFDPINPGDNFVAVSATATLSIHSVVVDTYGTGYTSTPTVTFADTGAGTGAAATASTDYGAVIGLNLLTPGSGYITPGGIKKFEDTLPGLGQDNANNLGQYIPVAVPDTTTFPGTDYYVIAVVQTRERMSSSLPAGGTLLREYVQLSTDAVPGKQVPLQTSLLDGTTTPTLMPDGTPAVGVDNPHYLGPTIVAQKDRAVRIVFYNLLPTGVDGDLFLPTDSSMMGSGMGPMMGMMDPVDEGTVTDEVRNPVCTESPKPADCFKDNRALLHLHGGTTPWISDGTPHQWITPANEDTPWPEGVAVGNVPDMVTPELEAAGVPDCTDERDGCQTFYYTNQQSARFMFYHDHSWGITRLNVYAGEAAGYVITDPTEQKLFGPSGTYSDMGEGIPLIIQDRTFVPSAEQLAGQDPTWDSSRWGGMGNLWYHHVYMPAQNPGDPSGMSSYGRWMYGPWFWPPATPPHGPIANPYFGKDPSTNFTTDLAMPCNLDDPSTWQYQVSPFCEPAEIPGTPNISVGMEQFNDTPIVNGTAYPTTTLDPKAYRFRILNAANDRFWNLSWYVADNNGTPNDPSDDILTEVALKEDEVAAAQTDINVVPTPDTTRSPAGPDWIQVANEGGFLPAPAVVPAQPTTWITDPTRFDVGNVDKHSMLLAPAERSDVIVDFSRFAGQTLILYNDAPAAFPARVANYDYYTGAPDTGAGVVLPGYGPNTRTIMQVNVAATQPAAAFSVPALRNLFKHHADGSGVFEEGQHPIIVGQAAYNSAYGTTFAASGNCTDPAGTNKCDGYARINQQGGDEFRFDNLRGSNPQLTVPIEPKALHDEMNSAAFDEFGRMTANLGLEAVPATPAGQNILLYPYVAPPTEVIDGTNLPKGDVNVQAISDGSDGTQIWKITHNGVDTHPIHFHLYDVQVLNRVTWDNIIIPPDASELGWKDTVRVSPLEDTIVALRPIVPDLPFEIPNSIRPLDPMMSVGDNIGSATLIVDPDGNISTIKNALVNFGWEYVYHCHILSHEEMDMMRPVLLALPPFEADGLSRSVVSNRNQISWNDNSITETSFILQRSADGITWTDAGTDESPLALDNTKGYVRSVRDTGASRTAALLYRVVARNTVGYGGAYPAVDADSTSAPIGVNLPTAAPSAPTLLTATLQAGPQVRLQWRDNANNEGGFVIERSTTGLPGSFARIAVAPARSGTGNTTTFTDTTIATGTPYWYRVAAVNLFGGGTTLSAYSGIATTAASAAVPAAPSGLAATNGANAGRKRSIDLTWTDNSTNETGFTIQRATNAAFTTGLKSTTVATNSTSVTLTGLSRATTYYVRIRANNAVGSSAWVNATPFPNITNP